MLQCFNKHKPYPSFLNNSIPRLIYSCKTEEHHAKMPRAMHMHEDMLEIVLIASGQGMHMIGDKVYRTRKGNILIYDAGVLHDEIANSEESLNVYCVAIKDLCLCGKEPNQLLPNHLNAVFSTGEHFLDFLYLFETIHTLTIGNSPFAGEIISNLLRALIIMVHEVYELMGYIEQSGNLGDGIIKKDIKNYLNKHYMEDINLQSISKDLHLSRYYISHLFKKLEGSSPMQYVIRRRIGEAQSLLINTEDSVTAIALTVGYKNSNHFHSAFLKTVGLTPKGYRNYWIARHQKKNF